MIDLGIAQHVEARSTGEPGQRTFHLRIISKAGQSASLKLEKQHLVGLRTGLREILARLKYQEEPEADSVVHFPSVPDFDFSVGRLGVGFSTADRTVLLEAAGLQVEDDQEAAAVSVQLTPRQGASLATQLDEIIAAGRPICPLCWLPIDPEGHVCVKSNGHSRQAIPDEHPDQE